MKVNPHILAQFPECMQKFIELAHEKSYKKGEVLHYGDMEADSFSLIVTGRLRKVGTCDQVSDSDTYNDRGRDVLFEYLERGDIMGEGLVLFKSKTPFLYDSMVEAESDIVLSTMGRVALARFKAGFPELYIELQEMVAEMTLYRLNMAHKAINEMVNLDAKERIRTTLNRLCNTGLGINNPKGTELHISRQDLALIVGCSREVAGRVVNDIKEAGYLYAKGKTIIIFGGELPEMF